MNVVYERCCGLDVHKRMLVACLILLGADGQRHKELRTFSTMMDDLLALRDWLRAAGCTHVAMERTGVHWKPIYHVLEGQVEVLVVNAQHLKAVPGRKTDVHDAEWLADLLQHGLLRASSIPSTAQRQLRELTRTRTRLVQQRSQTINRLQKVLQDSTIKLASVVSTMMGMSAQAISEGEACGANRSQPAGPPRYDCGHQSSPGRSSAGMCPGNDQSAGKRLSGRTRKGNRWLRSALMEAAHAAARTKHTYLSAQYRPLASRRGKQKAVVAVAHSIVVIIYMVLSRQEDYQELGGTYFDERDRRAVEKRLIRRLEHLGYQVSLHPNDPAA